MLTRRMLRDFPGVRQRDATSEVLVDALERLDRAAQDVKPASPRDYLGLAALQIRRELIDRARLYTKEKVAGEPLPEPEDSSADPAGLARWHDFHCQIADLDDDSFKVRERATRELAIAGPDAADALRHALSNEPSVESKRRIEDLLSRLKEGGDPQRLRFLRALEVLERIGTPAARDIVRDLAGKPLPIELKEEVQVSLRRMGDQP